VSQRRAWWPQAAPAAAEADEGDAFIYRTSEEKRKLVTETDVSQAKN